MLISSVSMPEQKMPSGDAVVPAYVTNRNAACCRVLFVLAPEQITPVAGVVTTSMSSATGLTSFLRASNVTSETSCEAYGQEYVF